MVLGQQLLKITFDYLACELSFEMNAVRRRQQKHTPKYSPWGKNTHRTLTVRTPIAAFYIFLGLHILICLNLYNNYAKPRLFKQKKYVDSLPSSVTTRNSWLTIAMLTLWTMLWSVNWAGTAVADLAGRRTNISTSWWLPGLATCNWYKVSNPGFVKAPPVWPRDQVQTRRVFASARHKTADAAKNRYGQRFYR